MSKITVSEIASLTSGSDTELTFATGASGSHATRLTLASGGNVGLGTSSPAATFHVSGDNPRARFTDTPNSVNFDIFMGDDNATVGMQTNHSLKLMTNDTEQVRIDTAGNVGIGMTPVALTSNHFVNSLSIGSNGPYILLKDENNANKMRYIANNTGEFQLGQVNDDGSTSKTLHLNVSTDGYTTTPTQPYISLIGNSETEVHTQGSAAVFTNFNEGGTGTTRGITWNSSNGRITVPVAGRYLVNVTIYFWCNNAAFHGGHIRINGTTKQEMGVEFDGVQGGRNDLPTNYSKIFTLAANDYIDFYMNGDVYAGPNHTTCEVTMVG